MRCCIARSLLSLSTLHVHSCSSLVCNALSACYRIGPDVLLHIPYASMLRVHGVLGFVLGFTLDAIMRKIDTASARCVEGYHPPSCCRRLRLLYPPWLLCKRRVHACQLLGSFTPPRRGDGELEHNASSICREQAGCTARTDADPLLALCAVEPQDRCCCHVYGRCREVFAAGPG